MNTAGNRSGYVYSPASDLGIDVVPLGEETEGKETLPGLGNNTNSTNVTCTNDYCISQEDYLNMIQEYIFPTTFEWVLISLYIVVFIVGLIGNFLVCFVVWRNNHMRTVTNLFIVNLSLADFLVILICLPPTVLGDVTETWYMGSVMCKIVKYIQGVSVSVSVLTLTVISIERYYAICHPLKFKSTITRARAFIIAIWVTAMVLIVPELVVLDIHRRFPVELTALLTICKPGWPDESQAAYQLFLIVALFFVPFVFMGVAYIQIARCLWSNVIPTESSATPLQNHHHHTPTGRSSAESQVLARRKVAKMLIAVVVMFGVCYFPVHLLNVLRYTRGGLGSLHGQGSVYFALVAHWLCYFNSAINPVIYNFMSEKFQKAFSNVFLCDCGSSKQGLDKSCAGGNSAYYTRAPYRGTKSPAYV